MRLTIGITGSSGFIGSHLVERLSESHEILSLDVKPSQYTNVLGDVQDPSVTERFAKSVDGVVHCAAQVSVSKSVEDPLLDAKNNVMGTLNLLDAARRHRRLRRFVYLSSAAVYGLPRYLPIDEEHPKEPISPYGASKLSAEHYVDVFHRIYGIPTVCIRPFNVYGRRQDPSSPYSGVVSKFLGKLREGLPPVIFGDGNQTRDFVNVRDVVEIVTQSMEREEAVGQAFNCGTGRAISVNELARTMISISGGDLAATHSETRLGDIRDSRANIGKAAKLLGWEPKVTLEEGLRELWCSP